MSPDTRALLRQAVVAEHLHLSIPSRPEMVEKVTLLLQERAEASGACTDDRMTGLLTSLTEAITNAIVHGSLEIPSSLKEEPGNAFGQTLAVRCGQPRYAARPVEIIVHDDGAQCVWTISDQGPGFNVEKVLTRINDEEPQMELASGRGILLMKAFMDDVCWANGGRTVTLAMKRRTPTASRRQTRVSVRQPMRAIPIGPDGAMDFDAAFEAVATNISAEGIGLLKSGPHQARRLLLELEDGAQTIFIPAQVCHISPSDPNAPDDLVQIGCRIVKEGRHGETTPDHGAWLAAIDSLITQHTPVETQTEHEARQYPRVVYTRPVQVRVPGRAQPLAAMCRDLSRTGLAFVLDAELPRGAICELVLEPDTATPVHLRARVVRVSHVSDRFFDYGAEYME